jgi:protein-disulfide isomerase
MLTRTIPAGSRDHAQGPITAPVTLVEYGDYECPSSIAAYPIVKQLQKMLGTTLRFVYRHFPLTNLHPHAERAAEAAEAAGAQGKFWELHDWIFEHPRTIADGDLKDAARMLGLDPATFARDLSSGASLARAQESFRSGIRSGVNGTPTFFINGVRHDRAIGLGQLNEALREALRRAGG